MPRSKREVSKEKMYEKIMPSLARIADVEAPAAAIKERQREEAADDEQVMLINLTYELVLNRVDEVMERFKCCNCEKCRKSVMAIALNSLPQKFVVSEDKKLSVLSYGTQNRVAEISAALVQAIIKIKANPPH